MQTALAEAIEAIRPALQADGGDMRILNLDEETGVLDIELLGACGGCPMSSVTLKAGIERILKDRVPGINEVRAKGVDFDTGDDFGYGLPADLDRPGTPVPVTGEPPSFA